MANDVPNNQVQIMHSKASDARQADPGYGKTPVRGPSDPTPPTDAEPYDPAVAGKVPAWGEPGNKTSGVFINNGEETAIQSGKDGAVQSTGPKGPLTGLNGNTLSHVEAHAGAMLQPGDSATLYINRLTCSPAHTQGCDALLPRCVPPGAKLTIYGPDGFVRVIEGARGLS